jgi:hypothetical protein
MAIRVYVALMVLMVCLVHLAVKVKVEIKDSKVRLVIRDDQATM